MIYDIILIIFIKDIIINFIIHDKLLCVEARAFIVAILLECTLSVWVLEIVGGNSPLPAPPLLSSTPRWTKYSVTLVLSAAQYGELWAILVTFLYNLF